MPFQDHVVQYPDKYKFTQHNDGTCTIIPTWVENPEEVIQQGTPINADTFQTFENDIDIAAVFESLEGAGIVAGSTADQSAEIQAVLNNHKLVYFPGGTYLCYNLRPQPGSVLLFHPDCILKFPVAAATTTGGNRQMFLIGTAADTTEGNEFDGFRTMGHFTIDSTNATTDGAELQGLHILGAKNVFIEGCTGLGFRKGYVVWAGSPYTANEANVPTLALNQNITLRNIFSFQSGWGSVAITGGRNYVLDNIHCGAGTLVGSDGVPYGPVALCVEPWHGNSRECENITARNITMERGAKGCAVLLNSHNRLIRNVHIVGIEGHIKLSTEDANGGILEEITLERIYIDGAGTETVYGIGVVTNNATVKNLVVRDATIKNVSINGVYCGVGTWYNVNVLNSGRSGFQTHHTAAKAGTEASFYNCQAINNNVDNAVNESGFRMHSVDRLTFINCKATDDRATKLQRYGLFGTGAETLVTFDNIDFAGNATAEYLTGQAPIRFKSMKYYSATPPTLKLRAGDEWYKTDTNTVFQWDGTRWVESNAILVSPDGSKWRMSVSDTGTITATKL